jgi:ABC-type glycerol-3-phosphate transport system permease component
MSTGFIFGRPVAILYNLFLDHFIGGLTATGTS